MKGALISASIFLLGAMLFPAISRADLSITDFVLTSTSVSFQISGTFPASGPSDDGDVLYFVNADPAASPGFSLVTHVDASSTFPSLSGVTLDDVWTGSPEFGDYFSVRFTGVVAPDTVITGSLSADWSSTAFNPGAVSVLDVYWGANAALPHDPATQPSYITGGVLVDTLTLSVPEPSTVALIAMAGGLAAFRLGRKRRR